MDITFDAINILIIFAAVGSLIYGWLVYTRRKDSESNILFFLLTVAVAAWGVAMVFYRSVEIPGLSVPLARMLYATAAAIPVLFFLFASVFPSAQRRLPHTAFFGALGMLGVMWCIALFPNVLIQDVLHRQGEEAFIVFSQGLHVAYALFIVSFFLLGYFQLIRTYLSSDVLVKTQVFYIFIGTLVPTSLSLITNLLLPLYGIFDWNWFGQISTVIMSSLITYGIFKHRIFNVRIIFTEVLIFFVWLISFLRIVFAETTAAVIFNTLAFGALVFIGYLLIRSVTREVESREKLEQLATELQSANSRLRELDRQKSEFLSIATHQLRGPLAGIRGHLSLIIDGSYGSVPKEILDVVKKIFNSSGVLAQTINDFLNVSRIEQGRMQYDMETIDCNKLIARIVEDLQPVAQERRLSLTQETTCTDCHIYADKAKLQHIFTNLIDNAIKYTEHGWVTVALTDAPTENMLRVTISDSGIGIDAQEIQGLFEKFVRARGASGINIHGTGLGLYVARQMVVAHHGNIWAESDGKGKGSRFIVELPKKPATDSVKPTAS